MAGSTLTLSARRSELIGAVVLLVFAIGLTWLAAKMPFGTLSGPGPGAFPFGLGLSMLAVSLGLLVRAVRLKGEEADLVIEIGHRYIWISLAALTVLALVFEPLGYLPATTLFMLTLLRTLSTLNWTRATLAALSAALLSWFFFVRLLGVNLPPGVLRFIMGGGD